MAIHKLSSGPALLDVTEARVVEGKFGAQVLIAGRGPTGEDLAVYINEGTAQRQLERLGLDMEGIVGTRIYMEQVQKDGRTYTNLRRVSADDPFEAPAPKAGAAPVKASKQTPEQLIEDYRWCVAQAMKVAHDSLEVEGPAFTPDNIVAMAATLFIQMNKR